MKTMRIGVALVAVSVLLGGFASSTSAAPNTNDPAYWETQTQHPSVCYFHEGDGGNHGTVVANGRAVQLYQFQDSWPGDHWELLVVNGGSNDAVYVHPTAGTNYFAPLNGGGRYPRISHWIVCKGTTPPTTSTSTTTTAPTTTVSQTTSTTSTTTSTTVAPTTTTGSTTTVPQETTTVPPTSAPTTSTTSITPSTLDTVVTTTAPSTTAPVTTAPSSSTTPSPTTTVPGRLPSTGSDYGWVIAVAAVLFLSGVALLVARRRSKTLV